jgi:hypothetical protein
MTKKEMFAKETNRQLSIMDEKMLDENGEIIRGKTFTEATDIYLMNVFLLARQFNQVITPEMCDKIINNCVWGKHYEL